MADTDRRLLTEREIEILELFAQGYTGTEIARQLWITHNTVRSHVRRMREATGTDTVAHLVAVGYRTGVLRIEVPGA